MKRRLRKKKHLKEFTEYGLECNFTTSTIAENTDQLLEWALKFDKVITDEKYYFGGSYKIDDNNICGWIYVELPSKKSIAAAEAILLRAFNVVGSKAKLSLNLGNAWYVDTDYTKLYPPKVIEV